MDSSSRFFHLQAEQKAYETSFYTANLDSHRGDTPRCPACGENLVGSMEWLPPFRVELEVYGKGAGDLVMNSDLLVSQRMADAFRAEGLTGLVGFDPVEVVKVKPPRARAWLSPYLRVQAVFGRAAVDEPRSRFRRVGEIACPECRQADGVDGIYGFRIEPGTWDGLDVFRPRGLQGDVVVSERFADLVKRHGFTNIQLTPTEQFIFDPLRLGPPVPAGPA